MLTQQTCEVSFRHDGMQRLIRFRRDQRHEALRALRMLLMRLGICFSDPRGCRAAYEIVLITREET